MANIQKRGDNSWFLTVSAGKDAQGKYKRFTKTVRVKTKKEAELELAKFRLEIEAGEYIAPEKMTFASFVDEWRVKYAEQHISLKTLQSYERHLKNRILPYFGHMQLKDIKPMHVLGFLNFIGKSDSRMDGKSGSLASGTIQYNYRVIKNIFSRAVEWRVIKNNPVKDVPKPKVTYKEAAVYDEDEALRLLSALEDEPYHWRMMIKLALATGLRRGELLGLEWKFVDLDNGEIDVRQSVSLTINGIPQIKEPKTKNSIRIIKLPPSLVAELREYYQHCLQLRDAAADSWQGDDNHFFVFANPDGRPFHQESPYQWFRNFLFKHQLPYMRFHGLRHTCATLLINHGVHAKVISSRLGHGNIATTMNIYGHRLRTADQEAALKFEHLFQNKPINDQKTLTQ